MYFGFNYLERTVLDRTGTSKCHNNGHNIDRQLKLEELGDGIINISSPHDGLDDAGEVIVGENDVAGLLGNVSPGDSHGKSHVCFLQSWGIVGSVAWNQDLLITVPDKTRTTKQLETPVEHVLETWK